MEKPELHKTKLCLNCGSELNDRFCGHCGQDSQEFKLSVWRLFSQFFESITEFDSKFFKSIVPLLFKPGFLTKQFLAGKRKSYLNPIQMYVFCSFLFFLTVSLLDDEKLKDVKTGFVSGIKSDESSKKTTSFDAPTDKIKDDSLENNSFSINFSDEPAKSIREYDSLQNKANEENKDGFIQSWLTRKEFNLKERFKDNNKGLLEAITEKFQENLPNLVFLLLPFFALLLKLLYIRRSFFYVEHLLFSVHIHCFVFIFSTVGVIMDKLGVLSENMAIACIWILFGYIFLAMKFMYEQSWFRSLFKFIILGISYGVLLVIGVAINLVTTLAQI